MATAPSLTPEALPAVTEPPSRKGVGSLARASSEVWRGCSSRSTTTGSALRRGTGTGAISRARRPLAAALAARSWDRRANPSWSWRLTREVGGDVLGRLRHRVDPVLRLQHRVHEPPADGRVVELGVAVEGGGRLADDERRPAHALHPARDDQVGLPGPDLPGPDGHRVRPRPAQPVDGRPGHLHRQPGQQHRHPGHVPVVLARLVGAPEDHVVDRPPVHRRQPPRQRPHDMGGQVVRPDPGQHPAIPPERRPHPIDQIRLTHGSRPPPRPLVQPIGLVAETVRLAAS